MRVRFTIDYRRDLVGLWYHRKVMGEHHISVRLPFHGVGLISGKPRRNKRVQMPWEKKNDDDGGTTL